MTVADPDVVDWLGLERGTGHVVLTIVDDLDWRDEHAHLLALQEKLNTYLRFLESGEVWRRLATELGREVAASVPIRVDILARHRATPHAQAFLDHATAAFDSAGFALAYKVVRADD